MERRFKHMPNSSAKELSSAIIKHAINDYVNAIIQDNASVIRDCEDFFLNKNGDDWFSWLSNDSVDGQRLIDAVKMKTEAFIAECKCHQPEPYGTRKAAKEAAFTCPCCKTTEVNITYDKRNIAVPEIVRYTCSNCHITLRMQWHGDVLPDAFNCDTCQHCFNNGYELHCLKHDKTIKRIPKICDDWGKRRHGETD